MSPGAGPAVLTVVLPLAGAVAAWLRPSAGAAAGVSSGLGIVATVLALGILVAGSGPVPFVPGAWPAALGIALSVDGTAMVFLIAGATTGMAATIHARGYFGAAHPFWALWLLLWAALNAVFLTADAFNAYVALELAGLTAATLVTLGGGRAALAAGLRYLMLSLVGATAYLAGVALFYGATGSLRLADYADAPSGAVTAAGTALVLTGLLLKAAIFPLHGWLPPAHARAPGPVSAVLSALVVKAAIYLAWRWLDALPPALIPGTAVLAAAGAGAVIWGSLQALRVGRLKAIVAYSTVAQLGYLAIGLALLRHSPLAATGVAWMALTHALAKGAAFLAAANVVRAAGHDRWPAAAGALRAQPLSLVTFALAAVSLAGLPPSGGFVAKWYLMTTAMEAGHWPLALVLAGGGLLAAAYLYRILQPALDPRPGGMAGVPPGRLMQYSALGLALAVTALGVAVPWLPGLMAGDGP
ncbi:complex I subunit 5 family protein [Arhodomonas sp. SL1]|uniref:complex I subunit 5 family protein n=1 Tax=Arhodomonas sp. SL1 TaxID=3425691 RepID=UPI003F88542E